MGIRSFHQKETSTTINDYDNQENLDMRDHTSLSSIQGLFIKGFGIITFLIFLIFIENYYRDPLFNISLTFEENWQNWTKREGFLDKYLKIITNFGGEYGIMINLLIVFICFSLKNSFINTIGLIFSNYLDNIMKLWYANPRPYWIKPSLLVTASLCEAGFGNPSGHSFASSYSYFALWHMIIQIKIINRKIIIKLILLLITILLIASILLSRLYLGVHSINQIIYGFSLGFSVYFIIYNVLDLHKIKPNTFKQMFTKVRFIFVSIICFIFCVTALILSYLFLNFDIRNYKDKINETCGDDFKIYKKFQNDGLYGGLTIFCAFGCYCGQIIFWYIMRREDEDDERQEAKIIKSNSNLLLFKSAKTAVLFIIYILLSSTPLVGHLLAKTANSLIIMFICGISLPLWLTCFMLYGPMLLLINKLKQETTLEESENISLSTNFD